MPKSSMESSTPSSLSSLRAFLSSSAIMDVSVSSNLERPRSDARPLQRFSDAPDQSATGVILQRG